MSGALHLFLIKNYRLRQLLIPDVGQNGFYGKRSIRTIQVLLSASCFLEFIFGTFLINQNRKTTISVCRDQNAVIIKF